MKKLLFALPLFALFLTLTYCTKENTATSEIAEQTQAITPEESIVDRAACTVTITSSHLIAVCGLSNNGQPCVGCNGLSKGYSTGTNQVFVVDDTVLRNFSITNISGVNGVTVTITTSAGITYCFYLHPNECRYFGTQSCMLIADRAPDC